MHIPNLRKVGLMSPRVLPRYQEAGLMREDDGKAADPLDAAQLLEAA